VEGQTITLRDFTGGQVVDKDPALLAPNELVRCDNVTFSASNMPRKRKGYSQYLWDRIGGNYFPNGGLANYYPSGGNDPVMRVMCTDTGIRDYDASRTPTLRLVKEVSFAGKLIQMLQMADSMFIVCGEGRPWRYEPSDARPAGCEMQTRLGPVTSVGAAGVLTGSYKYRISWVFQSGTDENLESDPSPTSGHWSGIDFAEAWETVTAQKVVVKIPRDAFNRPLDPPEQATGWRLYRFKQDFSTEYEWVSDLTDDDGNGTGDPIPLGTLRVYDNTADDATSDPHDALRLENPIFHGVPPEDCALACRHNEQLFLAKTPGLPNAIYWSAQGYPEYFQATSNFAESGGYREIEPNDGDEIMALVSSGGINLLVLKTNAAWMLREDDDGGYGAYKEAEGVGCVASNTVRATPIGTIWLGQNGKVWAYDGSEFRDLSLNRIATTLRGLDASDNRNAFAWYWNDIYYLAYPDDEIIPHSAIGVNAPWWSVDDGRPRNTAVLAYDVKRDCWIHDWKYPREDDVALGLPMQALAVSAAAVGNAVRDNLCLFGTPADANIYRWEDGTSDNGTSVEMVLRTGHLDFGDPAGLKRCGRTHAVAYCDNTGHTMSLRQSIDRGSFSTAVSLTWTAAGRAAKAVGTFAQRFKSMALQVVELSAADTVEFWGFEFKLRSIGAR